ncbi:MAG: hypothetical protein GY851_11335 [bacterium]|nr:hypothetical protein [bacterium]
MLFVGAGCVSKRFRPPKRVQPIQRDMEITGYNKCRECCNWKRNWRGKAVIASGPNKGQPKRVGITASGTKARVGTIAADTDLYPFGTIMYVPGYGYGRVEDRGSAIKGQAIDLYFGSYKQALQWGRQTKRVAIWLPPGS